METLPSEIVSEILACLRVQDITSFRCTSRRSNNLVCSTGCLSDAYSYRKAVSSKDWHATYDNHLLFKPVPGTVGAMAFRDSPSSYPSFLCRKVMVQALVLAQERDAVLWYCHAGKMKVPNLDSKTVCLFRGVSWDIYLYSTLSYAAAISPLKTLYMHVRSVPAILEHETGGLIPSSSQVFLCNLISQTRSKLVHLQMVGTAREVPHVSFTRSVMEHERRKVDRIFESKHWAEHVTLYPNHEFRSSTVSLGVILASMDPNLKTLDVSHYSFDEVAPSIDVASLCHWLETSRRHCHLVKVNLQHISFSNGAEFIDLLHSLCCVKTLESLRLSFVEQWTEVPMDPLWILFQQGKHIKDLRLNNVMRPTEDPPFHLLGETSCRSLSMTRMYLDTGAILPLVLTMPLLPKLMSLDLSSNGLDGACLGLFARALKRPTCTLQRLKLNSNIVTNSHVDLFCDALRVNETLVSLDLSDNFLGTKSAVTLLNTVLCKTQKLKYLNLDCNQVRVSMEDLYVMLAAASPSPPSKEMLRHVSLRANPLNVENKQEIETSKSFFLSKFRVLFHF